MDRQYELPSLKATILLGAHATPRLSSLEVYDVKFYPYTIPGVDAVFAVCGARYVIVCRCVNEKNRAIETIAWFEDDEKFCGPGCNSASPDSSCSCSHSYNSLVWSQAANGDPLICVTGIKRQIRVLNVVTQEVFTTLNGHGDDIFDLAISPIDPTILASCGADNTVRMWSLDPQHKRQPLAAICYGQGHKDQVLTLAYHRKGRYILSAGMDTRVNLWVVPDNIKDYAGTDKPAMIHYPHFSTTEVHMDFVDCIQWYNDLIISRGCREDKLILWKIDGFNSDNAAIPKPPVRTSNAVVSSTPVTVPTNSTPSTLSAWNGRFQRLLQFDLPDLSTWYMRFAIYHEMGRHPILVAGSRKSQAFFWDLQRVEDSGIGPEDQSSGAKELPLGLPRHIREGSASSTASSTVDTNSVSTKTKHKRVKEQSRDQGISNPFRSIKAHKIIEVPKYKEFPWRYFDWSRDGQWCVGVGDHGLVNVFHRWETGVPPIKTDEEVTLPVRHPGPSNGQQSGTARS